MTLPFNPLSVSSASASVVLNVNTKPSAKPGDRVKTAKGQACICQVDAAGKGTYLIWFEGDGTMIAKESDLVLD